MQVATIGDIKTCDKRASNALWFIRSFPSERIASSFRCDTVFSLDFIHNRVSLSPRCLAIRVSDSNTGVRNRWNAVPKYSTYHICVVPFRCFTDIHLDHIDPLRTSAGAGCSLSAWSSSTLNRRGMLYSRHLGLKGHSPFLLPEKRGGDIRIHRDGDPSSCVFFHSTFASSESMYLRVGAGTYAFDVALEMLIYTNRVSRITYRVGNDKSVEFTSLLQRMSSSEQSPVTSPSLTLFRRYVSQSNRQGWVSNNALFQGLPIPE